MTSMKVLLSLLLMMITTPLGMAQDIAPSDKPVLNSDIIEMSRAGVQPSVILVKIKSSPCKFDTSPSALVTLKESGVADEVLLEMVRNPNRVPQSQSERPLSRKQSIGAERGEPEPAQTTISDDAGSRSKAPTVVKRDPDTFRNRRRFSTRYDKFKDETHVSVGPFFIGGTKSYVWSGFQLEMTAHFFSKGRITEQPTVFYLAFRSSSKEWQFLRSRELYALVDGERLALGEGDHDSDIRFGGVSELLIYQLSADVFYKLGTAHHVELKIGNMELTLKDEHLEAFRDLYSMGQP